MLGGPRVEIAGRLVGKQNARGIGDRARDRDPLLFATRKLRRPMGEAVLEPEIANRSVARLVASSRDKPRIICGMITFSIAENSISR